MRVGNTVIACLNSQPGKAAADQAGANEYRFSYELPFVGSVFAIIAQKTVLPRVRPSIMSRIASPASVIGTTADLWPNVVADDELYHGFLISSSVPVDSAADIDLFDEDA